MLAPYTARKRIHERIRRLFGGMPCRVQAAALPWRQTDKGIEIMLITSRGTGRWVLPKGWPEGPEKLPEAAAREAAEEAGLSGSMEHAPAGSYFYEKAQSSGVAWRCEVRVFPMEVTDVASKWPERKKRTRHWFLAEQAAGLVREPDLGELIYGFGVNPRKFAA